MRFLSYILPATLIISNAQAFEQDDCYKTIPFKLKEGISICESFKDIKTRLPEIKEHEVREDKTDWKSENLSTVLFYSAFPKLQKLKHYEYRLTRKFNNYYIPENQNKHSNSVSNYINIKTLPGHKIPFEAANYLSIDGEVFDYRKYYNELVELNGEPTTKKHIDNELADSKRMAHWIKYYGQEYAENNKYKNYLWACWGDCQQSTSSLPKCINGGNCMTFSYSSLWYTGKRSHRISNIIYRSKVHPDKYIFK